MTFIGTFVGVFLFGMALFIIYGISKQLKELNSRVSALEDKDS